MRHATHAGPMRRVAIASGASDWMTWFGPARDQQSAGAMALADARRAFMTLSAHRAGTVIPPMAVASLGDAKAGQRPALEIGAGMWSAAGLPLDGRDGPEMPWSREEALSACLALARLAGRQCDPERVPHAATIGAYSAGSHVWQPLWLWPRAGSDGLGGTILTGIWRSAGIAAPLAAMATGKGAWSRHVGPGDPGSATLRALDGQRSAETQQADVRILSGLMRKAGLAEDAGRIVRRMAL